MYKNNGYKNRFLLSLFFLLLKIDWMAMLKKKFNKESFNLKYNNYISKNNN